MAKTKSTGDTSAATTKGEVSRSDIAEAVAAGTSPARVAKARAKTRARAAEATAATQKAKKAARKADEATGPTPFTDALRVGEGFSLATVDPRSTPGYTGDKASAAIDMLNADDELDDLQERLYAGGVTGSNRSVLLIVQGMDTSGKGGVMRHVVGSVDPQGIQLTSFKAPTEEERKEHYLDRIRRALPRPGKIGVFDRSQYEDVLIVRVHDLVPPQVWGARYDEINAFEAEIAEAGTTIIKVMLHISADEQKERLTERLENPEKHWKYNPGDLDERAHWDAYQEAYEQAVTRCSTEAAPWFVVPADRKWYARLAVQQLLLEHLRALDLAWPEVDIDIEAEKKRLSAM